MAVVLEIEVARGRDPAGFVSSLSAALEESGPLADSDLGKASEPFAGTFLSLPESFTNHLFFLFFCRGKTRLEDREPSLRW